MTKPKHYREVDTCYDCKFIVFESESGCSEWSECVKHKFINTEWGICDDFKDNFKNLESL